MQALTPKIRERRESACICFLEQGKTDKEEWFGQMKNGLPHSSSNPQEWSLLECGKSSQSWRSKSSRSTKGNSLGWICLPIHWFQGSVNGKSYNNLRKVKVWQSVRSKASEKGYWSLFCLKNNFSGRVLSNIFRPPKSPDLNPLGFYFLGCSLERSLW